MSVRQYIGARYVPKFFENSSTGDSTWAPNTAYEPLTIVTWNGNSYTSKKTVPAGIGNPSTAPEYWVSTGNYNSQIEEILEQIQAVEAEVNGIEDTLGKKLNKIKDRVFLFIGDSYDVVNTGYKWSDTAASKLGLTDYVVRSSGGYGFNPAMTGSGKWIDYMRSHPVDNASEITDIVIAGGTNDSTQTAANIRSGMTEFNDYLASTFPNTERIYLGYIGWSHLNSTQKGQHKNTCEVYLEGAKALGWRFLNGCQYILHNPRYILTGLNDRVHPNPDGVIQLGECIAMAISDGMCEYRTVLNTTFTPATANVTGNTFSLQQALYNGMQEINMPDAQFTAAIDLTSFKTLATCDDLGSSIDQYKYWHTFVSYGTTVIPCIVVSLNPNEITLWLRGATIPAGTQFQVNAFTHVDIM